MTVDLPRTITSPRSPTTTSKVEQALVAWRALDTPIEKYLLLRALQRQVITPCFGLKETSVVVAATLGKAHAAHLTFTLCRRTLPAVTSRCSFSTQLHRLKGPQQGCK